MRISQQKRDLNVVTFTNGSLAASGDIRFGSREDGNRQVKIPRCNVTWFQVLLKQDMGVYLNFVKK